MLDPNAVNYDNDKIINLNTFFKEDTKFDFSVDTIIHSHLFEHLYNPYELLLNKLVYKDVSLAGQFYINAIDTKSFEDRLYGSSNAIWAANQYAQNKNLATSRSRT